MVFIHSFNNYSDVLNNPGPVSILMQVVTKILILTLMDFVIILILV